MELEVLASRGLTEVRLASGRMSSSTPRMTHCDGWLECFTLTKPRFLVGISTSSVVREAQQ